MTVFVECYPDEALLRALGVPRKQVRHERCKGEVIKKVRKFGSAIGLVDQDPASAQPRDLANYEEVQSAAGLRLLARRGNDQQRIILVCPRLEEWLIERAGAIGVRTEDYGLPADARRLHSTARYDEKTGFRRFLDELIARDKAMHPLRQWVLPQ